MNFEKSTIKPRVGKPDHHKPLSTMRTDTITGDVGTPHPTNPTSHEKRMKSLIPSSLLRSVAYTFVALFLSISIGASALSAQSIFVDATNGSNINPGTSAQPVATINKGLELLANNGTLVIRGSAYNGANGTGGNLTLTTNSNLANNLASLTIRFEQGASSIVDLQTATITVDVTGTVTVQSADGTYLNQQSTTLTLTRGTVALDASTTWRLASGTTMELVNTANFSSAAPQKGTNLNLTYSGATVTTKTAGAEASYATYGNGNITVNLTNAAAALTLPASITTTGNFVKTDGAVTLQGNLAAAAFTNTVDNFTATGNLTTTGANTHTAGNVSVANLTVSATYSVTAGNLTASGTATLNNAAANLANAGSGSLSVSGSVTGLAAGTASQLINSAAGSFSTGHFTLTVANAQVSADYSASPVVANSGSGAMTVGDFNIITAAPSATHLFQVNLLKSSTGNLTLGNVTATNRTAGAFTHTYAVDMSNTNAAGTATVGSGRFRNVANTAAGTLNFGGSAASTITGNLSNSAAGSAFNLTGSVTVNGVLTNAGTGAGKGIVLGANNLTLTGVNAHLTNGGVISGTGIVTVGGGANSFNGGTLGNVVVANNAFTTTFATNAFTVSNFTVSAGSAAINIAATVGGAISVTGGALTASANMTAATGNMSVSGGTFTIEAATVQVVDFTLGNAAASVVLNTATSILDVNGNFTRTAGAFTSNNVASQLQFTGTVAQSVSPANNFQVGTVVFNNAAAAITVNQSIRANGNATITASSNVNFQGFNLIMNGGNGILTVNGTYTSTTDGGVYLGGVDGAGATVVQGGAAIAGTFIRGSGTFGNLFIAVGSANTATVGNTAAVTATKFSAALSLISGTLNIDGTTFSSDLSPVGTAASVVVYPESTTGITLTAGGTFNNSNVAYNLEYKGALTAVRTIGSEFNANVRNVTVATTGSALAFAAGNYTINGNLTVNNNATLRSDNTAAQSITIKEVMTVAGTIVDAGAGGDVSTFILDSNDRSHSITGAFTDGATRLALQIKGNNVTVAGSGAYVASKNIIDANVSVTGSNATISGIQELQQSLTINAATATSLSLSMIDRDGAGAATTGLVAGNVFVHNGGAGAASLSLGSPVDLTGTLNLGASGTVNFGAHNLTVNNATVLVGTATSTYTSTGGYLVSNNATPATINAFGRTIPFVRIAAAANLSSALVVSQMLDVQAALGGAQTLTIGGNANVHANVTNNVIFTATAGTATIALGAGDRTITGTATLNSDNGISITGTTSSRILTVTGLFTQTKGALGLTNSGLLLDANYVFTAGSVTATTGYIQMNTGAPATLTANAALSIPNLRLNVATSMAGTSMLTVSDNLLLIAGTFTNTAGAPVANRVTIGAGATIERRATAATFSAAPAFAGTANLLYTTAGLIATSFEAPTSASVINNMTADVAVEIDKNLTVNGTLTLRAALSRDVAAVPLRTLTMASGATIDLFTAGGSIAFAPTATLYNLRYRTNYTIGSEFVGTQASVTADDGAATVITLTTAAARTMASLTLGQNDVFDNGANAVTISGAISIGNGASISGAGALSIAGNLTVNAANTLATASNIVLNGTTAQTLSVPVGTTLALTNVTLNNAAGLTLSGGNMSTSGTFTFTSGLLRTGASNALILTHTSTSTQGFIRTSGHVVGNVTKTLPSTGTASNRVTFPVGAENESSNRAFSPASFTFNNPSLVPGGITMTVNHNPLAPANAVSLLGKNGFPIADGVRAGVGLARYPDSFYWTVKTSSPLSASLIYDMELERENYNAYCQSAASCSQSDVEDMRIIRRASGSNTDNPWRLQGAANQYLQSFQTTVSGNTHPTISVQNVQGGILAGDGTIFTYALKSNMVATTPAALTANVGQTRKVALRTAFTGGTSGYRYMVSGNTAATATGVVAQDTLTITAAGVGSTSFTVLATDSLNDSRQITVAITVNAGITAGTLSSFTLNNGNNRVVDISNLFTGGSAPLSRVVSSSDVAAATAAISGNNLTVTSVGAGTATITVTGTDATSAVASVSFTVTVNATFATAGTITGSTLRAADGVAGGQAAGTQVLALGPLFTGGTAPVAYTAVSADVAAATVSITGANLTVTAVLGNLTAATTQISLSAVDSLGATLTRTFTVTILPALGDVDGNAEIDFADARTILRANVGLVTLNAVQLVVADVNNSGTVNSFDASVVLRYPLPGSGISIPYVATKRNDAAAGTLAWGEFTRDTKASTITVPVMISNASGVYSVDFAGEFDVNTTSVVSIDLSELPQDWMSSTNVTEDGQIRIALAGSSSLVNALVANVTFAIDADSPLSVKANGFVNADSFVMESLEVEQLPLEFALGQNYPNPFNPTTSIRYQLPMSADVTIELYNMLGQRVMTLVNGTIQAGTHTISADFSKLSSGVYVYRIQARGESESFVSTRTMTLIK